MSNIHKSWLILLILVTSIQARVGPQLKDFLCGCEYCVTVPTQEPLDIGRHMVMCHSWRDATINTMKVMEEMKKEKAELEKQLDKASVQDVIIKEPEISIDEYTWSHDDILGNVYTQESIDIHTTDHWIYTEQFEWVWRMAGFDKSLYSYRYGWLYVTKYRWNNVVYWYDRRIWMLCSRINKEPVE